MSPDPRVDAYIARAQPFARPILERIRARVGSAVPEAEETIKWSAPAFTLDGKILLVMAAFKAHAALNFWRGEAVCGQESSSEGMGQFGKLKTANDLPPDAELDGLIAQAASLARSAPAPRKPKPTVKADAQLHPDFAAALDKSPAAKAVLEGFPPGARRDYLDWVAQARRNETRATRIETAIAWLSEGKKRNWKYERC